MGILKADNLVKIYGQGENEVKALNNVSLEIEEGEFVSIVGSSGSGKSTLLNMLGGLDRLTSGDIYINNKKLGDMKDEELTIFRRRNIGFIFQNYNLVPILNVYENIVLPIELDGMKIDEEYIDSIINILGLSQKLTNMPNNLSGGQQQRVGIARAMAVNPKLILLDEPTSSLDPELVLGILDILRNLANEHKRTMIIVTHEMRFAKEIADRIIFMDDGRIIEQGTPEEIFTNPQNDRTKRFLERFQEF